MDSVLKKTLTDNLMAAKNAEAKLDALVLSEIAVIDCQYKTSSRVKELVEDKGKRKYLGQIIQGGVASGGFVILVKILKAMGVF
ncbi:MAG: hypothetical protein IJQ34_02180 [Kiritimatiellae bacterium]|nr:hypothetical protein [Kiritimatiellia bacterium]